jgi:coenzyme F420 hydrogenase subunit beta
MYSYRNVCEAVVSSGLCVGCGVCAGVCPFDVLKMQFNEYGEYVCVERSNDCQPTCNLCIQVCPFLDRDDDETTLAREMFAQVPGIQYRVEVGYYLDCYMGHVDANAYRLCRSSGGLTTWLLQRLLVEQVVDRIVCVVPAKTPEALHQFAIIDNPERLLQASRSCYYPVEMESVLREIRKTNARYAVTGLPCFVKGLRLAMRKSRLLRERITTLVGLVCGQLKSKFFVEYVAALGGGDASALTDVRFRIKDPHRSATDYGLKFEWRGRDDKIRNSVVFWTEGMQQAWTYDYFRLNACCFCDDVFAETADVVLMDAWLPECKRDSLGCNLVVNRSPVLKEIWDAGASSGELHLESIDVNRIVESQRGQLWDKRQGMQYRSVLAGRKRRRVPKKRWEPRVTGGILDRCLWGLKDKARRLSRWAWVDVDKNIRAFRGRLCWIDVGISVLQWVQRLSLMIREGRVKQALLSRTRLGESDG